MVQLKEISIIFVLASLSLQLSDASDSYARIVGGVATTIESRPYLISLLKEGSFFCGGSLLSSTHVVTAAHCVDGLTASQLTVVAGATRLTETGVRSKVAKVVRPTAFNMQSMHMDVAVLKLSTPLTGTNITPIDLSTDVLKAGTSLEVSGWGITTEDAQTVPNVVRTVNVNTISRTKCTSSYSATKAITNSMFCASVPGTKDSCKGDSGGPAVYNGKLSGIVSWGRGCGRSAYPGVYTSVKFVRTFILNAMKM